MAQGKGSVRKLTSKTMFILEKFSVMVWKFNSLLKFCRSIMASSVLKRDLIEWTSVPCDITELRIDITLDCGQSFRSVL